MYKFSIHTTDKELLCAVCTQLLYIEHNMKYEEREKNSIEGIL